MSTIQFYRRYEEDGRCRIICTRCFRSLGEARGRAAVRYLEENHICEDAVPQDTAAFLTAEELGGTENRDFLKLLWQVVAFLQQFLARHPQVLLPAVALLLYGLPTGIELMAAHHLNPWTAIILPGDALGCTALIAILGKPGAGLLTYLLLTGVESYGYLYRAVTPATLALTADLVPTLLVLGVLVYQQVAKPRGNARPS